MRIGEQENKVKSITRRDTSECLIVPPSKVKSTPRHRKLMTKINKIEENLTKTAQNVEANRICQNNVETTIRLVETVDNFIDTVHRCSESRYVSQSDSNDVENVLLLY